MAATTKRRPPPRRSTPPRRGASTAKSAAEKQKRQKDAAKRAAAIERESRLALLRERWNEQIGRHSVDLAALTIGVLGLLALLGVFTDLAGPFGRAINAGTGTSFGRGRYLVPFLLIGAAVVLLVRGRRADVASDEAEDDEPELAPLGLRIGLGTTIVLVASVGLLHLISGRPLSSDAAGIRDAGGMLGGFVGGPLSSGVGVVGAAIVLGAALIWGALLVSDLRLHQGLAALAVAGRAVVEPARRLFDLPEGEEREWRWPWERAEVDLTADEVEDDEDAELFEYDGLEEADDELEDSEEEEEEDDEYEYEADEEEVDEDDIVVLAEIDEYEALANEHTSDVAAAPTGRVPRPPVAPAEVYDFEAGAPVPDAVGVVTPVEASTGSSEQLSLNVAAAHGTDWKLPPRAILKRGNGRKMDARLVARGGEILEGTLLEFGVDARLIGSTVGPTVTRYELELAPGVKVNKVTSLNKEIAYAMAAHDVRILAPIPGRSAIGVEVPNKDRPIITLGDILAAPEGKKADHPLEVGMGRDIAGKSVMANLATFPHVLIAGQTGAGKSSCINSIVTSLLMRATPDQVRMILIDPKRVELGQYNNVPHLLTEVVVNPKKAANALDWAVREMELRYDVLAEVGVRDITGFNQMFDRGDLPTAENPDPLGGRNYERLPFIVVVVDELADLMMVAARDVETSICRLAQMARAVGIHLVIATQRPSVDVITGVIKANIPSRLAFSVSTLADSRVILDQPGAEKLVGKGDMLMLAASSSRTERIQGAWVDEECVRKIVAHWRRQVSEIRYIDGVQGGDGAAPGASRSGSDDSDELLDEAIDLIVRSGLGSTSMLQRKLRVGFARAGRIMDLLERRGIVGPSEGSKARSVLMTVEELENISESGG